MAEIISTKVVVKSQVEVRMYIYRVESQVRKSASYSPEGEQSIVNKEEEQQTHRLMLLLGVSFLSAISRQLPTLRNSQSFHANMSSATRIYAWRS